MGRAKAHLIDPRDEGHAPLKLRAPVFDEDAIERADDALKAMSGSFRQWIEEEAEKLQTARLAADAKGWGPVEMERLYGATHDLKGMGATYGYPLVTQIAASLCRLIETDAGQTAARKNPALARAHVDAVRAAVRDDIRTDQHPLGASLLRALEAQVAALGVAPL